QLALAVAGVVVIIQSYSAAPLPGLAGPWSPAVASRAPPAFDASQALSPAPHPPTLEPFQLSAALRPHELFGFAPYWTLADAAGFDLRDLTTVAYFGVDVAADGSLMQSGSGWQGYRSRALVDLVDRAHAAGARVVLTAKSFDGPTLDALSSDPGAADRLAGQLTTAIGQMHIDGANLNFENAKGS